jgi:tRNA(Ile)-lysidine synthetase-like protein
MNAQVLRDSVAAVPPGRWAVGVSGGADSVALLLVLKDRPDLSLHVAHMDHQTRQGESAADARFVAELAATLKLPCAIALRSTIESAMPTLARNTAHRFRNARFEFFRQLVAKQNMQGILLAHHVDDQAETVLMRLLRGAGPTGLGGIRLKSNVHGLKIMRPLLRVDSSDLRDFLRAANQPWREDSSNLSDQYQRNVLRKWLKGRPVVRRSLLDLQARSGALRSWLESKAPVLADAFPANVLADLPLPIARRSACRWLMKQGAPANELNEKVADRLIEMASDAASPPRMDFPGQLSVRRRQGKITIL